MELLSTHIEEITTRAEALVDRLEKVRMENRALRETIDSLEGKLEEQRTEYETLKSQYDIIKLARSVDSGGGGEQSEELKRKINDLIKEIDQCLRLIGD